MLRYAVQSAALAVVLVAVFAAGVWLGMDVDAFNRNMVAVEGPPLPDPRCDRDVWIVGVGDRVDAIVRECYPGEHIQAVKGEMRRLNPHIESLGLIYPGDQLRLPKRGLGQ